MPAGDGRPLRARKKGGNNATTLTFSTVANAYASAGFLFALFAGAGIALLVRMPTLGGNAREMGWFCLCVAPLTSLFLLTAGRLSLDDAGIRWTPLFRTSVYLRWDEVSRARLIPLSLTVAGGSRQIEVRFQMFPSASRAAIKALALRHLSDFNFSRDELHRPRRRAFTGAATVYVGAPWAATILLIAWPLFHALRDRTPTAKWLLLALLAAWLLPMVGLVLFARPAAANRHIRAEWRTRKSGRPRTSPFAPGA